MSSLAIFKSPVVVLDTETTGFLKEPTAAPIELGAVLLDVHGEVVDGFETLIRPEHDDERHAGTWRWHANAGTGLTRELVEVAPTVSEAVAAFRAWLAGHGNPYLTAFHVAFDRPMLERIGFKSTRWAPCIMLRAAQVMGPAGALPWQEWSGDWKWPKAEDAMTFFKVGGAHIHRALPDAEDEAQILVALRRHELGAAQ